MGRRLFINRRRQTPARFRVASRELMRGRLFQPSSLSPMADAYGHAHGWTRKRDENHTARARTTLPNKKKRSHDALLTLSPYSDVGLPRAAVVGVLGGGQLGRMLAQEAVSKR